jgi:lysophospholipid acyltransferase (LPLAT)-like uncharacterized protein
VRTPIKFIVIPILLKWLMLLITFTCRVRWHDREYAEQFENSGSPIVFGMWHNCSTFSPWAMQGRNLTCMVSASRDGEYIARLAALFGNRTIRGSSSKDSSAATRAVLKLLRAGESIALTPDGPRGPKYSVQPGVVWLAVAAKAPIVPFHIEASRQWVLNSWDNHRFPKPFSTIHIGFGKPIMIDRVLFKQDPEQATKRVQQSMMDNVNKLKALANN